MFCKCARPRTTGGIGFPTFPQFSPVFLNFSRGGHPVRESAKLDVPESPVFPRFGEIYFGVGGEKRVLWLDGNWARLVGIGSPE